MEAPAISMSSSLTELLVVPQQSLDSGIQVPLFLSTTSPLSLDNPSAALCPSQHLASEFANPWILEAFNSSPF